MERVSQITTTKAVDSCTTSVVGHFNGVTFVFLLPLLFIFSVIKTQRNSITFYFLPYFLHSYTPVTTDRRDDSSS